MSHFKTKEEYFEFCAAWASAVNSPKAKKTLVPHNEWLSENPKDNPRYNHEPYLSCDVKVRNYHWETINTGKHKEPGWITAAHHALYNILRDKPAHIGFTPYTRESRMSNGESNMLGFYIAIAELRNYVKKAEMLVADQKAEKKFKESKAWKNPVEWVRNHTGSRPVTVRPKELLSEKRRIHLTNEVNGFLAPFNGTVSYEQLVAVDTSVLETILFFDTRKRSKYWF